MNPRPITLEGHGVRLEPLSAAHSDELFDAGRDPEVWRYLPAGPFSTPGEMAGWITGALSELAEGRRVPFAIIDRATRRAIGSTSYLDIRREDRALEIGWTWIAPGHQRTHVNTQCKLVLLAHAFDDLGAVRVQFKTDARNVRSQNALVRIGDVREGILRKSKILPSGYVRDSVYFSIIDAEWPVVRQRLEAMARGPVK